MAKGQPRSKNKRKSAGSARTAKRSMRTRTAANLKSKYRSSRRNNWLKNSTNNFVPISFVPTSFFLDPEIRQDPSRIIVDSRGELFIQGKMYSMHEQRGPMADIVGEFVGFRGKEEPNFSKNFIKTINTDTVLVFNIMNPDTGENELRSFDPIDWEFVPL